MLVNWLPLISLLLFAGMIACAVFGRHLARKRETINPQDTQSGNSVVDGAVFALLGLIIAFSFSGAISRFDERRQLAVEEANTIGTAYLRLDLLPAQVQPAMRDNMRQYLDSRIRFYRDLPDADVAAKEMETTQRLQAVLWAEGITATRDSQPATMLLLPALNDMFDIVTSRTMAIFIHPPKIIFGMLFGLSLISAALAGYSMARARSPEWFRVCAFAGVTAFTFNVVIDIEYPREGLIRNATFDQALSNLRNSMN